MHWGRRGVVATKTKRTLLLCIVVAVVAFLCLLFLYQNATTGILGVVSTNKQTNKQLYQNVVL